MVCKECGSVMRLDDRDRINRFNRDDYWGCDKCNTSCIETIRLGISIEERWHSEVNGEVKDTIISRDLRSR